MQPLFLSTDAILKVPSLEAGLAFYRDKLGHKPTWHDATTVTLAAEPGNTELTLSTHMDSDDPALFLVNSVDEAFARIKQAGGKVVTWPKDIPTGRMAVIKDPFGNQLTLVDLAKAQEA